MAVDLTKDISRERLLQIDDDIFNDDMISPTVRNEYRTVVRMALAYLDAKEGREGAKGIAKRMADELARLMATAIDPQDFHEINLLLDEYRTSLEKGGVE